MIELAALSWLIFTAALTWRVFHLGRRVRDLEYDLIDLMRVKRK